MTERAKPVAGESGFSLTETLVSMVILTTSLLTLSAGAVRTGALVTAAHQRAAASTAARVQVESLLALPYGSILDGTAETDGTAMEWTVAETGTTKEITLVYRYQLPGRLIEDTIMAAVRDE